MSRIYLSAPDVGVREEELCVAALRSGWVAPLGPMVDAFEVALADRCARRYAAMAIKWRKRSDLARCGYRSICVSNHRQSP